MLQWRWQYSCQVVVAFIWLRTPSLAISCKPKPTTFTSIHLLIDNTNFGLHLEKLSSYNQGLCGALFHEIYSWCLLFPCGFFRLLLGLCSLEGDSTLAGECRSLNATLEPVLPAEQVDKELVGKVWQLYYIRKFHEIKISHGMLTL